MPENKVVLVVEDEQPLLSAIKIKLEKTGFQVVSSRSVEGALNILEDKVKVDIIWLDHYLIGKENGLDLVAKLKKSDSKWKHIPIFVVSNTASADKVQSYIHFGIEKYFTKSDYRLDEIIADIEVCLNKKVE
ncbi:MAG: response regulator [Candidatus Berkelbacteria bacterium]|nr:response regulator [Candidatus Berkelbacteria bacterium]